MIPFEEVDAFIKQFNGDCALFFKAHTVISHLIETKKLDKAYNKIIAPRCRLIPILALITERSY